MSGSTPYLVSKARAHMGSSPSIHTMKVLINSKSVSEAENNLSSCPFYDDVIKANRPSIDLIAYEGEIRKSYAKMLHTYGVGASIDVAPIIESFKLKLEVENLQILFRALINDERDPDLLKYVVPVGRYGLKHYQRILNSSTPELALDFIYQKKLRNQILTAIKSSENKDELMFYISSSLEQVLYEFTSSHVKSIRSEIELLNLETVARAISLGVSPGKWIIKGKGKVAKRINQLEQYTSPLDAILSMINDVPHSAHIRKVVNSSKETIISDLEKQVDVALNSFHRSNFKIFSSRPEALYSFFFLKYSEMRDISKVFLGKQSGVTDERIKSSLNYFQY